SLVLAAGSPAFTVNAISYYSMGAHLCASLAYAALLLRPTPRRLLAAGAVGSLALTLHNPVPHLLFALPFAVLVAFRSRRLRDAGLLALGYLPGALLLGLGWMVIRCKFGACAASGSVDHLVLDLLRLGFTVPGPDLLWARGAGLCKLALWAVPGLIPLTFWGARALWHGPDQSKRAWWRAFTMAAALTLGAYLFVPYDQGHGWGYRYFHSAWGVLPLFGAAALYEDESGRDVLRRTMFIACVASAVVLTALRFVQVRTFIAAHVAQIPAAGHAQREIVFVREYDGYYSVDLVQNDPFMRDDRWVLISRGRRADEILVHRFFPSASLRARNAVADVWQVE
ncbi:MAG TPA: hypothetical protein VG496_19350, partial [Myxococcales bacterium]|nr:hypothetical protein [Myxococcales bacterium]